ncbi:MAG: hypothetical protein NTW87_10310 [Planctomycetota bacterium]|nr:hypothetical protein [Planctomycetota bacterium]
MNRCFRGSLLLTLLFAILTGCGSPPPPPKSMAKEIGEAERALDAAKNWKGKSEFDLALGEYQRAREIVSKAKPSAEGTELTRLQNMEEEARTNIIALETRKLTAPPKPVDSTPPAVADVPKTMDPAEKKRKEDEAAKAKRDADAAKAKDDIAAKITAVASPTTKKKKDDEPEPTAEELKTGKAAQKGEGAGKGGEEKAGEGEGEGGQAIKKAEPPFPAITDKSPPLQICKVEVKGKFVLAYLQVYNNAEQGKRITTWGVFFKDGNQQAFIAPQTVAVFPASGFKNNVPDLVGGQIVTALTVGSQQITGFDGLRLIAVGESERAKDVRAAAAKIAFHDGTNVVATYSGAAGGLEVDATLKALQPKK